MPPPRKASTTHTMLPSRSTETIAIRSETDTPERDCSGSGADWGRSGAGGGA